MDGLASPNHPGLQPAEGDAALTQFPAALGHAPVGGLERGTYMLGAGFGFVYGMWSV